MAPASTFPKAPQFSNRRCRTRCNRPILTRRWERGPVRADVYAGSNPACVQHRHRGIVNTGKRLRLHHLKIAAWLLPCVCVVVCAGSDAAPAEQSRVVEGMVRAQAARFERFEAYTRIQHYSVTTDRFGLKAEMVARIHRDRVKGKSYEVISRSGSLVIQSHVFDALLEAEVASSAATAQQGGELLTPENYSFRLVGQQELSGRRCWVLESEPKHKDKRLLKGKIWVDTEDFGVVHVEGRPSDSLSFWVGRPVIVQEFTKLSGFWWATRRHSYIDNMFLGKSDLVIDYSDYQFQPAPPPDVQAGR